MRGKVKVKFNSVDHKPRAGWFDRIFNGWKFNSKKGCYEKYTLLEGTIEKRSPSHWVFTSNNSGCEIHILSEEIIKQSVTYV